jgi:hypothetical protein
MLLRLAAVAIVVAVEAAAIAVEAAVAMVVAVEAGGKGSRQVPVVRNQESEERRQVQVLPIGAALQKPASAVSEPAPAGHLSFSPSAL